MSFFTNLFSSSDVVVPETVYPEPSFVITVQPNLYQGDATAAGQQVLINGIADPITFVSINLSNSSQVTTLSSQDKTVAEFEGIYIQSFSCENYLFEKLSSASFDITIVNAKIGKNGNIDNSYDIGSPLIDLFQAGFVVTITQYNPSNLDDSQQLFTGVISDYTINYNNNNLQFTLSVTGFLTILNQSACIQTAIDQNGEQIYINTLTSQIYNFNNLLTQLLNETIIAQSLSGILYYKAPDEVEANGNNGSAIGTNSNIYVDTPPTDNKLKVIIRSLYPYQRIFYVDNAGNFVITPLQFYFDADQNWQITMQGEYGLIEADSISIKKNTAIIQNRTTTSLMQLYTQFNPTNNTNSKVGAVAVATPLASNNYYPRLNDFITSQEYLQTLTTVQELNTNLLNNAGLLNIATNFNNVTGLVNNAINIDDNSNYITTTDKNTNKLKYYLRLYAAKTLAEQLFNETQITISIPTNLTFNVTSGLFRTIPLNQLVTVPTLTNNLLDNIPQYFCWGYRLSYSRSTGAITDLYLTKPYTYTALWSDEQVELMSFS